MSFLIDVAPETLYRSAYGSITGMIFVKDKDFAFPESQWSDFPIVVLGWWTKGVLEILSRKANQYRCMFMDGPYCFEIKAQNDEEWEIRFVEKGRVEKYLRSTTFDPESIVKAMLFSSDQIIAACEGKNWKSPDLDFLAGNCKALRSSTKL